MFLGINLTEELKDLYSENYRTLKKEFGEHKISGSIYRVHGLEELSSLKCTYYPKHSIVSMQLLLIYQWHIS